VKNYLLFFVIIALTTGCITKGGRQLGKGSAGTVIIPQTPQQINERNRPPLEPLPPAPISIAPAPPMNPTVIPTPAAPLEAVKSIPTPPESKPAEANPVIVNPKPAGKLKPFSPTTSVTPKLIDNKAADPVIVLDPRESDGTFNSEEDDMKINWIELIMFYVTVAMLITIGWMVFKMIKTNSKETKKAKKIKPSGSRRKVQRGNKKKT
jgi:hypothetical protein